jgi:YfiH family protein
MIRISRNGVPFRQFETLACHPGIVHGVFGRLGGRSTGPYATLNVGDGVGDDSATVRANLETILDTLGIRRERVVTAHQVHGNRVAVVGDKEGSSVLAGCDALVTNQPGCVLLLRFADCLPVLLFDPERQAVGLAHAGWRGCVAGVAVRTLQAMQEAFNCRAADVRAWLAPAIGPSCYEVGADVISAVGMAIGHRASAVLRTGDGRTLFDLPGAVRLQLQDAGVNQVEDCGLCTHCHTAEFYSHRAEGGLTGRFAVLLGLQS